MRGGLFEELSLSYEKLSYKMISLDISLIICMGLIHVDIIYVKEISHKTVSWDIYSKDKGFQNNTSSCSWNWFLSSWPCC